MDEWTFEDELNLETINIPRAALVIARSVAYPDLQISAYLAILDDLTRDAGKYIASVATAREKSEKLAEFLFVQEGFRGNRENYEDPRNSFLNEMLERRLGIPISLSILYAEIAGRLGLNASGVGLPGHFIVRLDDDGEKWYLDPFNGGRPLSASGCALLVRNSTGYKGPMNPDWLEPSAAEDILTRVLNNLRVIYVERQNWDKALAVVRLLRLIQPTVHEHIRDLGLVYYRLGSPRLAAQHLDDYLLREPEAADATVIREGLKTSLDDWVRKN